MVGGILSDTALSPGQSGPFTAISLAPFTEFAQLPHWFSWDENDTGALTTSGRGQSSFDLAAFHRWRTQLRATLSKGYPFLSEKEMAHARWMLEWEARRLEAEMR